jgi:hypothetical protein
VPLKLSRTITVIYPFASQEILQHSWPDFKTHYLNIAEKPDLTAASLEVEGWMLTGFLPGIEITGTDQNRIVCK